MGLHLQSIVASDGRRNTEMECLFSPFRLATKTHSSIRIITFHLIHSPESFFTPSNCVCSRLPSFIFLSEHDVRLFLPCNCPFPRRTFFFLPFAARAGAGAPAERNALQLKWVCIAHSEREPKKILCVFCQLQKLHSKHQKVCKAAAAARRND